jgi:hypothetical protein
MAQKETILGNYLNFPRFPLDCESMDYIQENIKHLAIIAQIAGCDRLIIKGCTGSPRSAGYVYVRTGNDLLGEILYFPGGSGARCSISAENINASANGETFNAAYTMRKLVSGTTGTWSWAEDFTSLSEISNAALKALADTKAASNHNHNSAYAALNHTHDSAYAAKNHNHDTAYAAKNHNHDTVYAAKNHNHDTAYAAINHTHNYSAASHTHDDRYYTETEIDTQNAALQSAIDAKQDQLSVVVQNETDYYHIFARRYGKVVTLHFDGYPTNNSQNTETTVPVEVLPRTFWPDKTVFAVGLESTNATDLLDNIQVVWLRPQSNVDYLNFGCLKKSNDSVRHMHAVFTFVLP